MKIRLISILAVLLVFISVNLVGGQQSELSLHSGSPLPELPGSIHALNIKGTTNVNSFSLYFQPQAQRQHHPLPTLYTSGNKLIGKIQVSSLKADHQGILKDFRAMVKSDQFPEIVIEVPNDEVKITEQRDGQPFTLPVYMTLGGVRQYYQTNCILEQTPERGYDVTGNAALKLSDFGIVPPEKFFGMIKVNDLVHIEFRIKFAAAE